MNTIQKKTSNAFGKDCYLIGRDKHGDYIWLTAATWDCDWYWGFGYIEVYTRQMDPANSRDIRSHRHWEGFLGKQEDGSYKHHINEVLQETVLTDKESWELSDLMKSFYTLREAAGYFNRGGSHLSSTSIRLNCVDIDMEKQINEVETPKLFQRVYEILGQDNE